MSTQSIKVFGIASALGLCLFGRHELAAQPPAGVEVMARGPVHEAFATPTAEPQPTKLLPKRPPLPLDEMPPEERPEGDVVWIGGYWAWDDDRNDYLWVSGCWRAKPPGREWVAGYWREQGELWQWVPGFWTDTAATQDDGGKDITYFPAPPPPPQTAPPGPQPNPDSFYVPGNYVWTGQGYAWRAGYWARVQPGYVWVPAHYRWSPNGYVFIAGYWDLAVKRRGILYAPVVIDPVLVGPTFVYTPAYAVSDTIVLDTLWVRPNYCHYYFGDYYGPRYRDYGFESCVVYSQRNYDSIVVYRSWEYRDNPRWMDIQINLYSDRYYGRAPLPPRTLVQQNTIINQTVVNNNTTIINNNVTNVKNVNTVNNMQVLGPTSQVAKAQGMKTVAMAPAVRQQAAQQARTVQQASLQQRQQTEAALKSSPPTAGPRTAAMKVPTAHTAAALPKAGLTNPQNPAGRTTPQSVNSTLGGKAAMPAAQPHAPATTHPAGMQPGQAGAVAHTPQAGQAHPIAGNIAPAARQLPQTAGKVPAPQPASHPLSSGQGGGNHAPTTLSAPAGARPGTAIGQAHPATAPAHYNPNGLRPPPSQPNTMYRPGTFVGGPPPRNPAQPHYGAGAAYPPPGGQRPPMGMAPLGAQRPPPGVNVRPQPIRPAPPPARRPANEKDKKN